MMCFMSMALCTLLNKEIVMFFALSMAASNMFFLLRDKQSNAV